MRGRRRRLPTPRVRTRRKGFLAAAFVASLTAGGATAERDWYVDNTSPPGGDGSAATPFHELASAERASAPGDTLHLARGDGTPRGQDRGLRLKPGQRLVGAPGGELPVLSNPAGDALVLASDVVVEGIAVDGAGGDGIHGTEGGRIALRGLRVRGVAGDGIELRIAGEAPLDLLVEDSTVEGSGANGVAVVSEGPSSLARVTVRRTAVRQSRGIGLLLFAGGGGHASRLEFTIADNRAAAGHGVIASGAAGISIQPNDASRVEGVVADTAVDGAGGRGIEVLGDDAAEAAVVLRGNQVRGGAFGGIYAAQQDSGRLDVTLEGNRVGPAAGDAYAVEANARESARLCLELAGAPAGEVADLRVRQREAARVSLAGFSGDGRDRAVVERFLRSRSAAPGRASAVLATGVEPAAGGCRRPDDPAREAGPGGARSTDAEGGGDS